MSYESEHATRRSRIDPKLRAAGWEVVPMASLSAAKGDCLAVEEFETSIGPPGQYLYPDLMVRVRVGAEIAPRFLWYMLLAPQARNFLRDRATGSTGNMPKIQSRTT
jgi:hypothetical protein